MSDPSKEAAKNQGDLPSKGRNGFFQQLGSSFKERTGTYVVATVFTILTVFSDDLAGRIKSALNRADAREEKYAALSRELSGYVFDCKLIEEYLANGWTAKDAFAPIIIDYNNDITALQRNEYANRAILGRYWNKDRRNDFVEIMKEVQTLDSTVHSLNDEFEKVNVLKTKEKVDPVRAKSTASDMHNLLTEFTPHVEQLLDKLE